MTFLPRDEALSLEECTRLTKILVNLGVTKVRITGCEPLLHIIAMWLFDELASCLS